MDLCFLGTGSANVQADRGQSGTLIRAGATTILLDCGSGTLHRMVRAGHHPRELSAIVLTHTHPDHVVDLVAILFELKQSEPDRSHTLPILGPPAAAPVYDGLMRLFGQWCVGETYDLAFVEIEDETHPLGELTLTARPMRHALPAIGVHVVDGSGGGVAFTGDTGPHPGVAELARGARVLVCDCTLPDGATFSGHMGPRDAGRAAREAGVSRLVLTHLPPESSPPDLIAVAGEEFDGEVTVAEDLLRISV
jgi:ribonuclease BN (tRNA processing enzyme)